MYTVLDGEKVTNEVNSSTGVWSYLLIINPTKEFLQLRPGVRDVIDTVPSKLNEARHLLPNLSHSIINCNELIIFKVSLRFALVARKLIHFEGEKDAGFPRMRGAVRNRGREPHTCNWLRKMLPHWTKGTVVLPTGTGIAKLEASWQTLEADDCGYVLLTVLTESSLGSRNLVNNLLPRGHSLRCFHVVHDGDVGNMGFLTDEGTLGAFKLVVCPWPIIETLLAEGVATATEESRLKVTSRGVLLLAQWAGEHGGRGYLL